MSIKGLRTDNIYDKYIPAGIAGYGGWASVTAATGTYTTGTYNDGTVDWIYYKWTGNGSVTTTAGVVDVLVVGGGSGPRTLSGYLASGEGGGISRGARSIAASTHTITIGSGGSPSTVDSTCAGGASSFGSFTSGGGKLGWNENTGFADDITGSTVYYGKSGQPSVTANSGNGGAYSGSVSGSSGVVIIRVPVNPELWGAPPAQGVLPNLGVGWASVTAATGTFTKGSYTDADGQWTYWQFTASSSSLTTTAGLVDALIVGGGAGTSGTGNYSVGGRVLEGIFRLGANAHTVTVGAGYAGSGSPNSNSSIGSIQAGAVGRAISTGDRTGAGATSSSPLSGITSSITGSAVSYAPAVYSTGVYGSGEHSGVVIVRVPTAFDLT